MAIVESVPSPPAPPPVARRTHLTRRQALGLPVLLAIPVLALFGVFGESTADVTATSATLELRVSYPTRLRYRQTGVLRIWARNRSPRVLDSAVVQLDTAYLTRFLGVRVDPAPRDAFETQPGAMLPNEWHLITAELVADRYGRHDGRVVVRTSTDSAAVRIGTRVFP